MIATITAETITQIQIRQHNTITNARCEMSACEMVIVFALLSKFNSQGKTGTMYLSGFGTWSFWQVTSGTTSNFSNLRNSSTVAFTTSRTKPRCCGLANLGRAPKKQRRYQAEDSEKMRPCLISLKSNFTSYHLQAALSLGSKFAKRIYQMASQ